VSALLQRSRNPQRQQLEADLAARIDALFGRCPTLCGFTVRQTDAEHGVLDLTCFPTPYGERAEQVFGEVKRMLVELETEQPEAAELLPGRTFARAFH